MIKISNFKFKFIISLILVVLSMCALMPISSLAIDSQYLTANQFDDSSYNNASSFAIGNNTVGGIITKFFAVILTILRGVAVGWAILMAISIAIKYMSGSSQVKSQIKVDMPTYVIGAVLLFGAAGIMTLIQYFVEDNIK